MLEKPKKQQIWNQKFITWKTLFKTLGLNWFILDYRQCFNVLKIDLVFEISDNIPSARINTVLHVNHHYNHSIFICVIYASFYPCRAGHVVTRKFYWLFLAFNFGRPGELAHIKKMNINYGKVL